jgi:tetratricopeptide (TPR) repeat protein
MHAEYLRRVVMKSAKTHFHAVAALTLGLFFSAVPGFTQAPQHLHYAPSAALEVPAPSGALAPRLQNLGDHVFPVTTKSEKAQQFINQGLNLTYGFNHQEAGRAFREAARLDPDCAMAYWGQALVLGPNINMPMDPENEREAHELARKAEALKSGVSPREQAFIDALVQRYSGKAEDRTERDRAYADAMRKLHNQYPNDLDAATLFAESLMDLRPWNYWTRDFQPYPETVEAIAALEWVMQRDLNQPGANHYYIHVTELPYPERAEAAADRLKGLMPGAGHMVHMPAHIYQRVGRYADASAANERAIFADEDYIAQCQAQGIYPITYFPHNIHFLWSSATMEGRSSVAIEAARKTAAQIPRQALADTPILQGFLVVPYYARVRFGKWHEILNETQPVYNSPFVSGIWRYARGIAYAGLGKFDEASSELQKLREIARSKELAKEATWSNNSAPAVMTIAVEALAGELADRQGRYDEAVAHLDKAVRLEDGLEYVEPPDWHYPVRHSLGAVLLQAGRPSEAEVVYWQDLRRNPENGWALFGLAKSLQAQGKSDEAGDVEKRFEKAWARADVKLTSSVF